MENTVVVDLSVETINESWLTMFGTAIKYILNQMFGKMPSDAQIANLRKAFMKESQESNIVIKGTQEQIDQLIQTLAKEKNYMVHYMEHGLSDDRTREAKQELYKAIRDYKLMYYKRG
jgi:N-dimethylarginine dimethylaminohydrolase